MDLTENWQTIRDLLTYTVSIAWDECHKIYLLMDEGQHTLMQEYGYDPLIRVADVGVEDAYNIVHDWYESSCGLRFVNSVRTVTTNPNDGFDTLIGQFEDCDDEDWDE